jgi:putative oxidoreductase
MKKNYILLHFLNGKASPLSLLELGLRLWLGYVMISNAPIGVTVPLESLGLPDNGYQLIKMLWDTGYLMHIVKGIELIGGIALVLNTFVPLTLIILMPVLINIAGIGIFIFHGYHNVRLVAGAVLLMIYHRAAYAPLLKIRNKNFPRANPFRDAIPFQENEKSVR